MPNDPMMGGGPGMDDTSMEGGETCDIPVSAIGDAKVGDTVSMTVTSIDEKSGTATLAPADESGESDQTNTNPKSSTIDKAAGLFNGGGE